MMRKLLFCFLLCLFVSSNSIAATITISGIGSSSTNYVQLKKDFYKFNITFFTTSNNESYNFELIDQYGNTTSYLGSQSIRAPGTYTFEKTVSIGYDNNFLISVDTYSNTSGNWEILITSVSEIEKINLYGAGYFFNGTGSSVTKLFYLKKGIYIVRPKVHIVGINSIRFYIYDEYGNDAAYINAYISAMDSNVPVDAEYSKAMTIEADGYYLLATETYRNNTGDWEIMFFSPQKITIGGIPGDIDGDGKIGLPEAIRALQTISGARVQ